MALSDTDRLLRSYRAHIRDLQDDVMFLKDALWRATGGNHEAFECDDPTHDHGVEIPVMVPRQEEETGKTDVDSFVKSMLMD